MNIFTKIFLGISLILTISLSFAEYYSVSYNFKNNLNNQTNEALKKHQVIKYALITNILSASDQNNLDDEMLNTIVENIENSLDTELDIKEKNEDEGDFNYVQYSLEKIADRDIIVVISDFSQCGYNLRMQTQHDISFVFKENNTLQKSIRNVFIVVIIIGTLLSFFLAYGLTRPIKKLSKATNMYTKGNYSVRVEKTTCDEIGLLTDNFNHMADSIQEKIDELKLAVKKREEFNASFAHELKTPMTGIIGYADMIYQNKLAPEQIREVAGYIMNEGMRLESLSFKLLQLITLDKEEYILETLDSKDIFEDIENGCKPLANNRNVDIFFDVEQKYVRVEYDLFKTMIINLVDNASKSGAKRITVVGKSVEAKNGKTLFYISIDDDGRGIPENELTRIKEAFYMVDKSRSRKEHGAGLGLALCDKIANIHGSKLKIVSKEGIGTRVILRLREEEYEE